MKQHDSRLWFIVAFSCKIGIIVKKHHDIDRHVLNILPRGTSLPLTHINNGHLHELFGKMNHRWVEIRIFDDEKMRR